MPSILELKMFAICSSKIITKLIHCRVLLLAVTVFPFILNHFLELSIVKPVSVEFERTRGFWNRFSHAKR